MNSEQIAAWNKNKTINPLTGRKITKGGPTYRKLEKWASSSGDKILNPKTGRMVLKSGKIGQAILSQKKIASPKKPASPKKVVTDDRFNIKEVLNKYTSTKIYYLSPEARNRIESIIKQVAVLLKPDGPLAGVKTYFPEDLAGGAESFGLGIHMQVDRLVMSQKPVEQKAIKGLVFPIDEAKKMSKPSLDKYEVIYLASVLQYIISRLIIHSRGKASRHKRKTIILSDVNNAIKEDHDFTELIKTLNMK